MVKLLLMIDYNLNSYSRYSMHFRTQINDQSNRPYFFSFFFNFILNISRVLHHLPTSLPDQNVMGSCKYVYISHYTIYYINLKNCTFHAYLFSLSRAQETIIPWNIHFNLQTLLCASQIHYYDSKFKPINNQPILLKTTCFTEKQRFPIQKSLVCMESNSLFGYYEPILDIQGGFHYGAQLCFRGNSGQTIYTRLTGIYNMSFQYIVHVE